jgi:hypothetical protein
MLVPDDDGSYVMLGDHGYDNRDESMHPIFFAFGPAFRRLDRAKAFRNVDLYPLMSHLLRLPVRLTNGSFDNVKHILVEFSPENLFLQLLKTIHQRMSDLFAMGWLGTIINQMIQM